MDDKFENTVAEKLRNVGGVFFQYAPDRQFAWELYCSLCNQVWVDKRYDETQFIRWEEKRYREGFRQHGRFRKYLMYSWRAAGGFVARVAEGTDDYLRFYCCGGEGGVGEGEVTQRAKRFWESLGFKLIEEFYDKVRYQSSGDGRDREKRRKGRATKTNGLRRLLRKS